MCCAQVGMKVVLLDMDPAGLERGMGLIQSNYARSVKRGSRSQKSVDTALANIEGKKKGEHSRCPPPPCCPFQLHPLFTVSSIVKPQLSFPELTDEIR